MKENNWNNPPENTMDTPLSTLNSLSLKSKVIAERHTTFATVGIHYTRYIPEHSAGEHNVYKLRCCRDTPLSTLNSLSLKPQ
ncbi:hypothetical protein J6590_049490, partial [Homalodisca vitripennis]